MQHNDRATELRRKLYLGHLTEDELRELNTIDLAPRVTCELGSDLGEAVGDDDRRTLLFV